MGALSAALALTEEPGWADRFEITVHQMGHRLGGKGASGRNGRVHDRIEEHGLHVWLGFYDNAFSVLRRCYEELRRPAGSPFARIEDAFVAHDHVGVAAGGTSHERRFWLLDFPRNGRLPGAPDEPLSWLDHARLAVALLERHRESSLLGTRSPGEPRPRAGRGSALLRGAAQALAQRASEVVADALEGEPDSGRRAGAVREWMSRRLVRNIAPAGSEAEEARGLAVLADLAAAAVRGLIRDRALLFGLDVLDEWDFRAWLTRHGARPGTVDAPLVKAWYDLAFAYEDGDTARPNFAAGAALRAILKTCFTYKGAVFWKMRAGMGDVVFAPIYEVLRRRGVRFAFFHRVDAVEAEPIGAAREGEPSCRVARVRMTRQATVRGDVYEPLIDVDGLPCWPSEPLHDQLVEGKELAEGRVDLESSWSPWPGAGEVVLERGRDFDDVVFGISLGAVPHLCPSILAACPAWRDMAARVKTVATQAAQLWFDRSLEELRWKGPGPIIDAYDDPFNTWADMSFLLPRERWPRERAPASLAYLVGPLHEPSPPPPPGPAARGFEEGQRSVVRSYAKHWLGVSAPGLWPATGGAIPGFDWSLLHREGDAEGPERLSHQYLRANVAPSERYVQSPAGSTRYRLFVESAGVEGIFPVGDWVNTGINSGDIEAATISGLQAARAITGRSRRIVHEGDGWARHRIDRGRMP